jgi:hypothetical protein
MSETISILFLSANPWTTSRILVDEEAREIFYRLQEGPDRERFILHKHAAIRPADVQRLLMMYRPQIVHFSGHASKKQKIILGGVPGRGKQINRRALVDVFALYREHLRLVFLNACFTRIQARSLSAVIDYSIGSRKPIGDRESVNFAAAFYRALGFGRSVKEAFDSAKAEVALANMTRAQGLELFVRNGLDESDSFPRAGSGLENKLAGLSAFSCQLLPGDAGNQYAHALNSPNLDRTIDWNAIDLLRGSILNGTGEAIRREQFILTYEWAKQVSYQGPMASDPATSSSLVRTVLSSSSRPQRRTQSSRGLANRDAGSTTVAINCSSSSFTVKHTVLELIQPKAKCERVCAARVRGAHESRRRHAPRKRGRRAR